MNTSFKPGAGGFLIKRLQAALGVEADGHFGPKTARAVGLLQRARLGLTVSEAGCAGPAEFRDAGIAWPSEFERAMNLVSCFEGTSFGDCNLRDIDGAGLTLGVAGFTTAHGEVQELLARFFAAQPVALDGLPGVLQSRLAVLLSRRGTAKQWRDLFYGADGNVMVTWREAFAVWGESAAMQQLQLRMAHDKFWVPAVAAAESLGFSGLPVCTFFLDVAVQNGGWRKSHLVVARRMVDWHGDDPVKALVVAARAVAACAKEQWRNDVLSRKMAIATGRGVVHGREYDLGDFAVMSG